MKEKFSVLTSVYRNDNPEWIDEAISSLFNQTVKPSQVVLVIDGPVSDEIKDTIYRNAKKHKEIEVVVQEENLGLGKTMNNGLSHCKYELVARMDADDISLPDRFEKQLAKFEEDESLDLVGGVIKEFVGDVSNIVSTRVVPTSHEEIAKYLKKRNPFNHMSVMFRKSKVEAVGGYQHMHYMEDYYLWSRMFLAGCKMANLKDVLAKVRTSEDLYKRRGGMKYFRSQKTFFKFLKKNKVINCFEYLKIMFIRFNVHVLMPNWLRQKFYMKKLRQNSEKNLYKKTFYNVVVKRFFDFLLSFMAILILSPIFIITYLLSLLFLGGNPIFKQYRPGKNGKIFPLYKFRSMSNKKDKDGNLLPDKDRITWWGKIIRKTSLDELPQLFNILAGHMSIVGPRPRLVKDMIFYPEEVMKAYTVRPGLTGPAQVYDRKSEMSWESVFDRDLEYAKRVTFIGDLKLFIGTFTAVLKGGSSSGSANSENIVKREYYYSDYLLNSKKITKQQYDLGIEKAGEIIKSKKGSVDFEKSLQSQENLD